MNAFVNLKQLQEPQVREDFVPEWPEILERQQALETPVWVEEWLNAAHQPMCVQAEDRTHETWLETTERQQPIDAPAWQAEWLDWADNRPVAASAAQNAVDSSPTHTVCNFYSSKHVVKDSGDTKRPNAQRSDEYLEIAA